MNLNRVDQDVKAISRHSREKGFSLLELSIVICITGLLAGGGMALMGAWVNHKLRSETLGYLQEVQQALLVYAQVNGKMPYADSDADGKSDAGVASGGIPYAELGVRPADSWGNSLKYEVRPGLAGATACSELESFIDGSGLAGWTPEVWDDEASEAGNSLDIGAITVSSGQNGTFDAIDGHSNATGAPYLRHTPQPDFDDLVLYLGPNVLYYRMKCGGLNYPPL